MSVCSPSVLQKLAKMPGGIKFMYRYSLHSASSGVKEEPHHAKLSYASPILVLKNKLGGKIFQSPLFGKFASQKREMTLFNKCIWPNPNLKGIHMSMRNESRSQVLKKEKVL